MVVVVEGVFMGLDTHFLMGMDTHSMVVVVVVDRFVEAALCDCLVPSALFS